MPPIRVSSAPTPDAEPSSGCDDENDKKDEVDDLHHFVKHRHLRFENEDADGDQDTGNPWAEERAETSSVEEFFCGTLCFGAGMSVSHPDKLVVR